MSDSSSIEFIQIIREAVAADPRNLGLRVDLIELLLEHDPFAIEPELAALANQGANAQTLAVLKARAAAAQLRHRNTGTAGQYGTQASALQQQTPPDLQSPPPHPSTPQQTPQQMPRQQAPTSQEPRQQQGPQQQQHFQQQPQYQQRHSQNQNQPSQPAHPIHRPSRPDQPRRIPLHVEDQSEQEQPMFEVERPKVRLDDVAGMFEVKKHLEASFLGPIRNPELAQMYGQAARGSLVMYGPPGCGKTFIARAIAGELDAQFIHVTLADIMGQYWGQTEKAIHAVFEQARAQRPCVIFFDEFDAIGGRRNSGSSGSQQLRMVTSQLLVEFDGVDASNDGIYVLAATNRPWDIDPALRRPGRLDRTVLVLPPDDVARAAILAGKLKDKPATNVDLGELVNGSTGYSGADLSYVVDTAVQQAFSEAMRDGVPRLISTPDLLQALHAVTPSTRAWFEQIKPVLEYGIDDGTFKQLRGYLREHRI